MSVQFILGRAGSGKTAWCLKETIAACGAAPLGPRILWLVPRQATYQIQRDLCCGGELNGYFRVRVLSMDLLCRQILKEVGGHSTEITSIGRQIILGHLLRRLEPQLSYFRSTSPHGGLTAELDATLNELESAGADLAALQAQDAGPANSALALKLRDLDRLYRAYAGFLGENRLDPAQRVRQAIDSLGACKSLQQARVFVDGFLHFTHRERCLLVALARHCQSVHIALTVDPNTPALANANHLPDETSLFFEQELEHRKLWFAFGQAGIKVDPPAIREQTTRFESSAIKQIERWRRGSASENPDGLELIEAPDQRAEIQAAALRVRDLVAGGMRYRDIAVLARDLSEYQDLIAASFSEHGIPYFLDQRRGASHHPLIQLARSGLLLADQTWPHDAMMVLIKSGLVGLTHEEADELENYVLVHSITGAAWTSPDPAMQSPAQTADQLRRRVVDRLTPFIRAIGSDHQTVRQICTAIFDLLESLQVRQTLRNWIAQDRQALRLEQTAEHEQVWIQFSGLLQQFVDLLGEEVVSVADFQAALDGALSQFELAMVPPTLDQVLVGQVDRTRSPAVKAAIVLGLSDGQFPCPQRPSTVLNRQDRDSIAKLADVLPDKIEWRAMREEFLGYFAFTRASQILIATRPAADPAGRAISPGSLWQKLRSFVPAAQVSISPGHDQLNPTHISTPRQLVTGLMQWVRRGGDEKDSCWPALHDWFARRERQSGAIDLLHRRAWPALSYVNEAGLGRDLARALFSAPLNVTARQLETFRACPFQHFLRYGLQLRPRDVKRSSGQDISQICRDALDQLLRNLLAARQDWCQLPANELTAMLHGLAAEAASRIKGERMLDRARDQYLLQRVFKTLTQVMATQRAAASRGEFRATSARVRFGKDGWRGPLRIATCGGNELSISGEIDRIDTSGDASIIHDYHLCAAALSLAEVYHGLSLKLVISLLSLEPRPVGALVTPVARRILPKEKAPELAGDKFHLFDKPRGLIDSKYVRKLDRRLTRPGSDVVAAYLKIDGTFGNRGKSDLLEGEEMNALLAHVRKILGQLGDDILSGNIAIKPYKMGNKTPCSRCGYRDVCRFEASEGYAKLQSMGREEVLDRLIEGGG